MRIAFSKPTRDAVEQRTLLDRYRTHGYEGLQLKGSQYAVHLGDPDAFRREWGDDHGSVSALIAWGDFVQLTTIINFAAAVGSERVVFCHGVPRDGLTDNHIAGFARQLSTIAAQAADQGVAVSLHHHYDNPVMHRHDFDVFFDAADGVGLTIDTGHLAKSGVEDMAELIGAFAPVIDNIHAKDWRGGEFRLLGDGDIDLESVFAALRHSGYDGWLCVDEESSAGIEEGMRASMGYLRKARIP